MVAPNAFSSGFPFLLYAVGTLSLRCFASTSSVLSTSRPSSVRFFAVSLHVRSFESFFSCAFPQVFFPRVSLVSLFTVTFCVSFLIGTFSSRYFASVFPVRSLAVSFSVRYISGPSSLRFLAGTSSVRSFAGAFPVLSLVVVFPCTLSQGRIH